MRAAPSDSPGVYDPKRLTAAYKEDAPTYGSYKPSKEQSFTQSRVAHELSIFKRHVSNIVRLVAPFYIYPTIESYLGTFLGVPVSLITGFYGGMLVAHIFCITYQLVNLALGSFISPKLDAFKHWDFLPSGSPYLGNPEDFKASFKKWIIIIATPIFLILAYKAYLNLQAEPPT